MDLSIPWKVRTDKPNTTPATEEELSEAMEKIRTKALKSDGRISVKLREEVADTLRKMIDDAGTGYCIVEPGGVSGSFDPDKNCHIRTLIVCSSEHRLDEAMDW